jgi:hypothetical protein
MCAFLIAIYFSILKNHKKIKLLLLVVVIFVFLIIILIFIARILHDIVVMREGYYFTPGIVG